MASTDTEPMSKLKGAGQDVLKSLGEKAMHTVSDRVSGLTEKFDGIADGGPASGLLGQAVTKGGEAAVKGENPVGGALKGAMSGVKDKITGGGKGGNKSPKATKAMNIIESVDVGVPIRVAYNQWTSFDQFPSFMKKVETVDAEKDEEPKMRWKAQVFWSHREWEATIKEQVPDERIVWTSTGAKGRVDGAVSFHELGPNLTRILVVLEYYPQGFMERTGNIWRAAGRRARLEIKHFRRHVMTRTIQNPDDVEGWRGTIHDGEIVQTHEEALEEEQQQNDESDDQSEDEYSDDEDYGDDEYAESDEGDDGEEGEEESEDEGAEDEYDEGQDAEDEEDEEEERPRRRRAS